MPLASLHDLRLRLLRHVHTAPPGWVTRGAFSFLDVARAVDLRCWYSFANSYGPCFANYSSRDPRAAKVAARKVAPIVSAFRPRRGKMSLGGVLCFLSAVGVAGCNG